MSGAEERYEMLRRLASLAMRLAEEVCERAINSPYHPEPVHEPTRAFATVSRALRLTVVLQARFEADWFAFRDTGVLPTGSVCASRPRGAGKVAVSDATSVDDREDAALETLDRTRESLHEHERFDEILSRPFDTCVAAIRADLGLEPGSDVTDAQNSMTVAEIADEPVPIGVTESASSVSAPRFGGLDPPNTG